MKRTLLVVSLCLATTFSFAQKKAVKEAKSAMNKDVTEARQLIKQALVNEETKNDPETWKIAGDIEYSVYDKEREKQLLQQFKKAEVNEDAMYNALYDLYDPYLKAYELGELPDAKGKVKNKVKGKVIDNLKIAHQLFTNGGLYFSQKGENAKAVDFFERYWELPDHEMFGGNKSNFPHLKPDSTFATAKYYAIILAVQAEDHDRTIKFAKKLIAEPYVENSTFVESDPYEILANEYNEKGDTITYIDILKEGANKFPRNKYFTPNLINVYIKKNQMDEAVAYIDQAIQNDPANACDLLSVKATIFADQKQYDKAEQIYSEAIKQDASCVRSLEGIGVLYILQAQDIKNEATLMSNRKEQAEMDKKAVVYYEKAITPLEEYRKLLEAQNADSYDIRLALNKLQTVYYNLSMLDIDKSQELKAIGEAIEALDK